MDVKPVPLFLIAGGAWAASEISPRWRGLLRATALGFAAWGAVEAFRAWRARGGLAGVVTEGLFGGAPDLPAQETSTGQVVRAGDVEILWTDPAPGGVARRTNWTQTYPVTFTLLKRTPGVAGGALSIVVQEDRSVPLVPASYLIPDETVTTVLPDLVTLEPGVPLNVTAQVRTTAATMFLWASATATLLFNGEPLGSTSFTIY